MGRHTAWPSLADRSSYGTGKHIIKLRYVDPY